VDLTTAQRDALTELINIGYARAAGALSKLTGHRIRLEVPKVAIHRIEDFTAILSEFVTGEVASVNQVFSGPLSGNALLLLDEGAAALLSRLLTNTTSVPGKLDLSAREVITEVGNIVLNACLGVFGNLLQVQVSFSVPKMRVEAVESVLTSIVVSDQELSHALMVHTRFHVRESDVSGYLVMILGVTSLDRLLVEIKNWEDRQMAL
jgi:chemotaxis protein CheC